MKLTISPKSLGPQRVGCPNCAFWHSRMKKTKQLKFITDHGDITIILEVNQHFKNGGSFWKMINLTIKKCWFGNQPIKNGGWTSRDHTSYSFMKFHIFHDQKHHNHMNFSHNSLYNPLEKNAGRVFLAVILWSTSPSNVRICWNLGNCAGFCGGLDCNKNKAFRRKKT